MRKSGENSIFAQKILKDMARELIGREVELGLLRKYMESSNSEFVAVYGRRRVGKTFLIRKAAEDDFAFFVTGVHDASKADQLINFAIALQKHSGSSDLKVPKNWILAFYALSQYLETLPDGRKVIFIDELPWMDTAKSGFISALENFWNSWASLRDDVKLIVCGSATSWMMNNLIHSRGGLHNRLTHHILLESFTLGECENYFKASGFSYSRKQIAECYMIMGGVPYYLSLMEKSKSLAQNIDTLFFRDNAPLADEFTELYSALYRNASPHISVVTALSGKGLGLTRAEILKATGLPDNGALSTVIEELEHCGFIRTYEPFGYKASATRKREPSDRIYQLVDFYTLFYFRFIRQNRFGEDNFWSLSLNSPLHNAWSGPAFEMLCLSHIKQVKKALGISGVSTRACTWRSKAAAERGAQIDLLIDRKDETINVCEMKFSDSSFEITKDYEERLSNKLRVFRSETQTPKSLILTMVTPYGVKKNSHSDVVQSEILVEDLFE